ncbi:unnamed protein product (macronuclear) [Paramecium tetraurelia]|uniref:Uncharacterized protein n=1 Tax=Paramecium tetraurelia TaxID=5888 RepID=A0DVG8_PARTE|nr:uncharacterized protein GSPATT00020688001 [Paramecium tetraurelia]CAK87035.1 unnamed protein product [Paramecium tetraurelia]|eukprot:XP_001454432.1 hypothetical protein (macronuclear) [Paramecium tetraurelia strain d4-2]
MYFLPSSQKLFEEYFSSRYQKEKLFSSPRPPIAKEYFRIRSQQLKEDIFLLQGIIVSNKISIVIIQDGTKQNELSKLEKNNKFKTKIVLSYSQELSKNSFKQCQIFLQTAIRDTKLDGLIKDQYLQTCLSVFKLQNHLINDIIDFSQINAKLLDLLFSQFKLQKIINEITEQFRFQFQFKNLSLAFETSRPMSLLTQIKTDY